MATVSSQPTTTSSAPPSQLPVSQTTVKAVSSNTPSNNTVTETVVQKDAPVKNTGENDQAASREQDLKPPPAKKPALEVRYNELLKIISEVGKDIKPAYTNSKSQSDRLRKNIVSAKNVLRECLSELDRISRNDLIPKNNNAMDLSI